MSLSLETRRETPTILLGRAPPLTIVSKVDVVTLKFYTIVERLDERGRAVPETVVLYETVVSRGEVDAVVSRLRAALAAQAAGGQGERGGLEELEAAAGRLVR